MHVQQNITPRSSVATNVRPVSMNRTIRLHMSIAPGEHCSHTAIGRSQPIGCSVLASLEGERALGTSWDMHASRKIMLKHFDARAAEYHAEIFSGNQSIAPGEHCSHTAIGRSQPIGCSVLASLEGERGGRDTGFLATLGTSWDMHASRKIMLKHFDARAAEYHAEIFSGLSFREMESMKYLTHGFKQSGTRNCTRVVTIIPRILGGSSVAWPLLGLVGICTPRVRLC
jgi:hypothetical protein